MGRGYREFKRRDVRRERDEAEQGGGCPGAGQPAGPECDS